MQKIAIIVIIAFFYAITAELSMFLAINGTIVSPVWPPAGIALASLLIFDDVALFGVFLGCLIADFRLSTGGGVILISFINGLMPAIGASLQAYVGKLGMIKFSGSNNIFKNTHSVLVFIFISAFTACLINASIGATTFTLTGYMPVETFPYAWLTWWIADAVGVITITSTIMACKKSWKDSITKSQLLNLIITWICILIVAYITLSNEAKLVYLLIPFAMWSAFQFEIRFSLITGLLISSVCFYAALHGSSEFIGTASVIRSITLIQIFISIIFLTILLINTILSDRKKAYQSLKTLNDELEQRVLARTKDLSDSNRELEVQKTKLSQAFEVLKQSHARLMQTEKMASLGVLTAGVAHEIKNPLNAMSATVDSIKMDMEQIEKVMKDENIADQIVNAIGQASQHTKSLVLSVKEGIKRTAEIIADLCAFAKADELEMTATDLHHNIDSTLNILSSEIKGHVKVVKEYGDIPPLICHPGKINQVIMNIVINAIHVLQKQSDGVITIKTEKKEDSIILTIKDNGPGMKKEVLDKLFTPFFTTKKMGQGTGLGLFLSYNIIREHNGSISVASTLNQGTEFTITLPIKGM